MNKLITLMLLSIVLLSGCVAQHELDRAKAKGEEILGKVTHTAEELAPITEFTYDCGTDIKCIEATARVKFEGARCALQSIGNVTAICTYTKDGKECALCCNNGLCKKNVCGNVGLLKTPTCL